jgi:hypothetical protein
MKVIADFNMMGRRPTLRTEQLLHCKEFFGERIVGRGLWPPRSPDLPPAILLFVEISQTKSSFE